MRRSLLLGATLLAGAAPAAAQPLRDQLGGLLTFGTWGVPLRVGALSADGRSITPNDAFAVQSNAAVGSFFVSWMTASASSTPLASTGGGRTFRFVGGAPVEDQPAPGPIFGERASTLGRGAVLAGANYTGVRYTTLRGLSLHAINLTLTQGGTGNAAADALAVDASLDYRTAVTAFYATAGVLDRLDVGVVVPVVQAHLAGQSTVNVVAGSAGPSSTVIGGTPDAPTRTSLQRIGGRATGIGDVALRAKLNLLDRPAAGLALLADVRLPTGDAANLLGSGATAVRVLGVYSGRYGPLVPYVNAGYLRFSRASLNDALLGTVGVDADLAPWATVSLAAIGQHHPGRSAYQMPNGVLTNVPTARDDALSSSIGAKLGLRGTRVTVNLLSPFTRGGPRPDVAYTFGLERTF